MKGHKDSVWDLCYLPHTKTFASSSGDGEIKIWNIYNGLLQSTIKAHSGEIFTIEPIGNSNKLVSGSADSSIKIWDWKT